MDIRKVKDWIKNKTYQFEALQRVQHEYPGPITMVRRLKDNKTITLSETIGIGCFIGHVVGFSEDLINVKINVPFTKKEECTTAYYNIDEIKIFY